MEQLNLFAEARHVLNLEAYYEVEATNDYENMEIFVYDNDVTAIEVARALSISFSEVAVHLVVESLVTKDKLSKTIYTLKNSDEEAIAEAEIENAQIMAETDNYIDSLTAEDFAKAMLEEE